jgi:gliding motility-associated-like protein
MKSTLLRKRPFAFLFLVLALATGTFNSYGQVFWSEDFGTNSGVCDQGTNAFQHVTTNGMWDVVDLIAPGTFANTWYISSTENGKANGICSDPSGGCILNASLNTNRTLHVGPAPGAPGVSCPSGDCGAIYDLGNTTLNQAHVNRRVESPVIDCSGKTSIQLSFVYILGGEPSVDYVKVVYFDGLGWLDLDYPLQTFNCGGGSSTWTQKLLTLPTTANNNPNVKLGFVWRNDDSGTGTNPSFAVDDIQLINVAPPSGSDFFASDTTICAGDTISFTAVTSGASAWGWSFQGATPATTTGIHPTGILYSSPGSYNVTMIAFNGSGVDTVVKVNYIKVSGCLPPAVNFAASSTQFCQRTCIDFVDSTLNADPGSNPTWTWKFPGAFPVTASNLKNPVGICYPSPGTYDVVLTVQTDYGIDSLRKSLYITVDSCPLPVADFSASTLFSCSNQCINFNDNSQYMGLSNQPTSWQWYFPGATVDTSSAQFPSCITYSRDGLYDVQLIVTNNYGSDTLTRYSYIRIESVPSAFVGPDTAMFFGNSYQLTAGGGFRYAWSPSTGLDVTNISSPLATPTATTTYTCTISDSSGCSTTRQVTVTILHNDDYFVPNSFSPNGDGRNDYLFIRGNNFLKVRFSVFDRWGELLFETEDPMTGWDGTYKGKMLNPGVYTWVASIIYESNSPLTTSGTVTLLR